LGQIHDPAEPGSSTGGRSYVRFDVRSMRI
jgi:hypothetical protein